MTRWGPHRHRVSVIEEIRSCVRCRDHFIVFNKGQNGDVSCSYVVHDEVLVTAMGTNKKAANLAAASQLLLCSTTTGDPGDGPAAYLSRLTALCTCVPDQIV